jgi:hypothetical protein
MVVVRKKEGNPVLVGMVSKTYELVQHATVLGKAHEWLQAQANAKVPERIGMRFTTNFERVCFDIDLGEELALRPDGKSLRLRLNCRNSVDGSTAIHCHLRWFRLVCSNGLAVGVTVGRSRLPHKPNADLEDAFRPLHGQLGLAHRERDQMKEWADKSVAPDALQRWVDGPLAKEWGPLGACRVWHILNSGHDVAFNPPFRSVPPTERKVKTLSSVPAGNSDKLTVYAVSQALSWVASRRRDIDEAQHQQADIGRLIEMLPR